MNLRARSVMGRCALAALLVTRASAATQWTSPSARATYDNLETLQPLLVGTRSTADMHEARGAPLRREFAAVRERLDYGWHTRYSVNRQRTQDAIVRSILDGRRAPLSRLRRATRDAPAAEPWAVFTAGCMGAGKTHVMGVLGAEQLFPLGAFVRIDLDAIRAQLPETRELMVANPQTAGLLTQQEAGTIAEIATEEALRRGRHVWVDSSLKDDRWWGREFRRIRAAHPSYKLAIVHVTPATRRTTTAVRITTSTKNGSQVTASYETVVEREARRGEQTGRRIPPELLKSVYAQACPPRDHRRIVALPCQRVPEQSP